MCGSMADIQSAAAEIRRGRKERRTNHSMKIYMVSLLHRATINKCAVYSSESDKSCSMQRHGADTVLASYANTRAKMPTITTEYRFEFLFSTVVFMRRKSVVLHFDVFSFVQHGFFHIIYL